MILIFLKVKQIMNNFNDDKKYKNNSDFNKHLNVLRSLLNLKKGGGKFPFTHLDKYKNSNMFKHYFTLQSHIDYDLRKNSSVKTMSSFEQNIVYNENPQQYPLGEDLIDKLNKWEVLCEKHPIKAVESFKKEKFIEYEIKVKMYIIMFNCWSRLIQQYKNERIMFKIKHNKRKQNEKFEVQYSKKIKTQMKNEIFYVEALDIIVYFDDKFILDILNSLSILINDLVSIFIEQNKDTLFFKLIDKIIKISHKNKCDISFQFDIKSKAINTPMGKAVEAIMFYQINKQINVNNKLLPKVKNRLNIIIRGKNSSYYYGRSMIAFYTFSLYKIDEIWVKEKLIPLFNWKTEIEAMVAWSSFFYNLKFSSKLLFLLHDSLLATVEYINDDDRFSRVYCNLFAFIALNQISQTNSNLKIFSNLELRNCIKKMHDSKRSNVLKFIAQKTKNASDKPNIYWSKTVKPFFECIWPEYKNNGHNDMQLHYKLIILFSNDKFPEVVQKFSYLLKIGTQQNDYRPLGNLYLLEKLNLLPERNLNYFELYPNDCISLLSTVLTDKDIPSVKNSTILKDFLGSIMNEDIIDSNALNYLRNLQDSNS